MLAGSDLPGKENTGIEGGIVPTFCSGKPLSAILLCFILFILRQDLIM